MIVIQVLDLTSTTSTTNLKMYPTPQLGSSLLLSFSFSPTPKKRTILILGSSPLSAHRAFSALEAGARVLILAERGLNEACDEVKWRVGRGEVEFVEWDGDEKSLIGVLEKEKEGVYMAFVTPLTTTSEQKLQKIYEILKAHHVLTNIADHPSLSDFGFMATHRFSYSPPPPPPPPTQPTPPPPPTSSPQLIPSPLQIALTTNGHGCRLATRLRREIVARLPNEVGEAVRRVGVMRRIVLDEAAAAAAAVDAKDAAKKDEVELKEADKEGTTSSEIPSPPRSDPEHKEPKKTRQLRWLAQISEYWPLEKLASLEEGEMRMLLDDASAMTTATATVTPPSPSLPSQHYTSLLPPLPPTHPPHPGEIYLVGSGPGHPALLTVAAYQPISLILSDKLVPTPILALIPASVRVIIARKFPGNADASQSEMMGLAVEAARRGERVLRLKQGDPGVYARLAEEYLFFSQNGFVPVVVPGLSSALVGPLVVSPGPGRPLSRSSPHPSSTSSLSPTSPLPLQPLPLPLQPLPLQTPISLTSRGISDSILVLTGVGRGGSHLSVPPYERGRSVVLLMGVGRLREVVSGMIGSGGGGMIGSGGSSSTSASSHGGYPSYLPTSLIERASLPDQRVISSTLGDICEALEWTGEKRAPGMVVVGWCCLDELELDDLLAPGPGAETNDNDMARVNTWLGRDEHGEQRRWRVSEGVDWRWGDLFGC
ncbi:hypothetical protein CPB83DRAFT_767185 [Crepidotus variabilis]|uniref:precorrin-2 dehydrogenase n=1 Tax=Crepidotus variabilis TaxID=179855 RepID=A0A9P6EFR4_9AGAR|nr:hypothetical protein CPB83DRAFT_767185 [Crepidotus variabilis]